jgi:general secretion pathway protein G
MLSRKQDAFTLIEIMIVVIVIGVLATMVGPRIMKYWETIKLNQTKATIAGLQAGIQDYYGDVGSFPKRLDYLLDSPGGKMAAKWRGPYLKGKDLPLDPWNTEYEYNSPPIRFKAEYRYKYYEIFSLGPDKEESADDIQAGE